MRRMSSDLRPGGPSGPSARRISVARLQDLGCQQTESQVFPASVKAAESYAVLLFGVVSVATVSVLVIYQSVLFSEGSMTAYFQQAKLYNIVDLCSGVSRWLISQLTDGFAWKFVLSFVALHLAVLSSCPASKSRRCMTRDAGHETQPGDFRPGGAIAFIVNVLFYLFLSCTPLLRISAVYDHVLAVFCTFFVVAFLAACCLLLPRVAACSSKNPVSGYLMFLCGAEKNPELNGVPLRQLFAGRLFMLLWQLVLLACLAKRIALYGNVPDSMVVSFALQLLYIAKYFVFEQNYLSSEGIMFRRVGFIYLWNRCFLQPALCCCSAVYMVRNGRWIGWCPSLALLICGLISLSINYQCDRQKQIFRSSGGTIKIWGRDSYFLKAKYKGPGGVIKSSLLLANGWWGVCRHINYTTDMLAVALWTVPVCSTSLVPYVYIFYVTCFLLVRCFKDDARCRTKYGIYWEQYCRQVPYILVPALW